jgi:drug/metabolite transporter (DMT)-like permease
MAFKKSPNNLHVWGMAVLLVVTLIWGTSFPLLKGAVSSLSPSAILATRFVVAALPFTLYLRFLNLPLLRDGVFLGLMIFSTLTLQTVALETTSANRAAFIASFNVILVPLLGQLLGITKNFPCRRNGHRWHWSNVLGERTDSYR